MKLQKLTGRRPKAKTANLFVKIVSFDKQGRPKVFLVPGSQAKRYRVILYRQVNGIHAECLVDIPGQLYCPGNQVRAGHGIVCYHVMAAVDKALQYSGYSGSWCRTEEDALKILQMKREESFIIPVYPGKNIKLPGAYVVVEKSMLIDS